MTPARLQKIRTEMTIEDIDSLTLLPAFRFSIEELCREAGISFERARSIVSAFSIDDIESQRAYRDIGGWNCLTTHPFIRLSEDDVLLFQAYSLAESAYDTPIYWMRRDKNYRNNADKHRGDFTEVFVAERLASVFGKERVYQNVLIFDGHGHTVGEIDVLVLYADRALVVQAKSKKLTEEARKGAAGALEADLKKAVNSAYEQAYSCATLLLDGNHQFVVDGTAIEVPERGISEVFLLCVTSEFWDIYTLHTQESSPYMIHQTNLLGYGHVDSQQAILPR